MKKRDLKSKLVLNKSVVAKLNNYELGEILGGNPTVFKTGLDPEAEDMSGEAYPTDGQNMIDEPNILVGSHCGHSGLCECN